MRYGLTNILAFLFLLVLCTGCGDGWGFGFKKKEPPTATTTDPGAKCTGTNVGSSGVQICSAAESIVTLANTGTGDVDLGQWTLENKAGQVFTFGTEVIPAKFSKQISVSPLVIQPSNESLILRNASGEIQSEKNN